MRRNWAAALIFSQSARSGSARRVADATEGSLTLVRAERGDGDAPAVEIPGADALPEVKAMAAVTISDSLPIVRCSVHDVPTDQVYCSTNTCVLMYLL